jgi:hypothetical protein
MAWVVRRLLIPFAVGSVVCTFLLLGWAIWGTDTEVTLGVRDFALAALFVAPFLAVGLGMLVPIALLLRDLPLPRLLYPLLLAAIGALLGAVVVLPISNQPYFLELSLPAACGALSALVWFAFNRDAIRRQA